MANRDAADRETAGLRLSLMRHAEADLAPLGATDHVRPLTGRGIRQAQGMGQRLARDRHLPDQVLCSDAERALQTARNVLSGARIRAPMFVLPDLYDSSPETILETLAAHADPLAGHVLLVAHNPGIAEVASFLAGAAVDGYPPGTCAGFTVVNGEWQGLRPDTVRLARMFYADDDG